MDEQILKAIEDLEETFNTKVASVKDHDREIMEIKSQLAGLRARGGRIAPGAGTGGSSFADAFKSGLLEKKSSLQKKADRPFDPDNNFEFELKSVGDMTFPTNFSSANVSTATLLPGIIAPPRRPIHIRELLPGGQMGGNHFVFLKETSHDGDPATVAEGAAKPQMDVNLAEVSSPAQVIAAWLQISNQMLYDVEALTNYVSNRMLERLYCIEDNQLLSGNGTAPNFLGINSAGNFTAATAASGSAVPVELLIDAIAQLAALNRRPSGIILSPVDYYNLVINKASTSGLYNLPSVVTNTPDGTISITGVPVIWTAEQAAGTYTVGDFTNGTSLMFRESPRIQFFVDATLAKANKTLIRIEERAAFSVYTNDHIIKGTF
jgi:HK97 family phage major capsid protein